MPSATPLRSVLPICGTAFLMSLPSLAASLEFTPASLSALSIFATALLSAALICLRLRGQPAHTISRISTPIATRPSRTIAAPPARGTPWRPSTFTIGPATAAQTQPRITGTVIDAVSPSSQTRPISTAPIPTSSHVIMPRSRSHCGALKRPESSAGSIVAMIRSGSAPAPSASDACDRRLTSRPGRGSSISPSAPTG